MTQARRQNGRARLAVALISAVSLACMLVAPAAHAAASVASVEDATVSESGSNAVFTVTLSESNGTTTVTYSTSDNTAIAGTDYTATSGTLTFGPGETSKTVSVPIIGDALDEPDETFFFTLRTIQNGTFEGGDPNAVGTIVDDDAAPAISITDASVTEGNSGTTTTTVNVSLSAASGRHVSVEFTTADGTATFSPGGDYHSQSGRIVFVPGDTVETITVTVVSDTIDENDETFFVNLFNPEFATIGDGQSVITIVDDDDASEPPPPGSVPAISIGDTSVTEGNSGTVQGTVTVTLSEPSTEFVGVDFATQDNTATFSGGDYHSQSGRLVFDPGETSKTITVTVVGDTTDELDETFFINLSGATNATISDNRSVITIVDDDTETTTPPPPSGSMPSISIADASVAEGDQDETKVSVTVSLSAATSDYVSVDFQTSDGTALFSDADYWSMSGRLVFAPGDTTETITATVVGDLRDEADEVFYIDLSNPSAATISDGRGGVTILDDDGTTMPPPTGTPAISVSDASAQEGDSETTTATVTISLSEASGEYVTVDVTTTAGTATFADGDYWDLSGRIVFDPGVTSQTLQITINGDTLVEGDEVFYLDVVGSSTNATVADSRSAITILDDDRRTAVGPARGPCANHGFNTGTPIPDGDGEIIVGTNGDDVLTGTDGDDIICGLGGDDVISALAGDDQVVGNAGDDEIDGGSGKDELNGNRNRDTISGRGGNDVIVGGTGHDTLKGNGGIDTIRGEDGNDILQGGKHQDTLIGGTGADTIRGWNGHDVLRGGRGHDILNGHAGFDICRGGRGNNVVRNCER